MFIILKLKLLMFQCFNSIKKKKKFKIINKTYLKNTKKKKNFKIISKPYLNIMKFCNLIIN